MKQNLKKRKYDLLILGSSPLAALTLLQASNRGLDAALVSQSDFGSYESQYGNNIQILNSGKQIFFKALCFKYGALSFNMMKHAFHLNKSQYELKDLAPRSLKQVKYNHYYSAEMGILSKAKQNAKDFLWTFLNTFYSISWITDAGISYGQQCDKKKKTKKKNNTSSSEQKSFFNQIDSTYGLKRAMFKSKNIEVNWNRVVRDTLLTASIKDFYFQNKKDADYLANVSIKDIVMDDRTGNIQKVVVFDNQLNQGFYIQAKSVVDFRVGSDDDQNKYEKDGLQSVGIHQSQEKKFNSNSNSENYHFCVQTPHSLSFLKNPIFLPSYSFSKYEKSVTEGQIDNKIKLNNVRTKDRNLKKFISTQDLALDKILTTQQNQSSALSQYHMQNLKAQTDVHPSLSKFRQAKRSITYKIAQKLNKLINYLNNKTFNKSSYKTLEKPYKYKYEYQSDQKGCQIKISGGNPNFVIANSRQIIERILNQQNFRGTAFDISQSYHSVGEYVLSGSYSAPSVAAFDTSPGTSMVTIQKFKEEVQNKYVINDQSFYHIFYNYGYIGTLKIIDLGLKNKLIKRNQKELVEQEKKMEISSKSLKYPFSVAQVLYLIQYQQLASMKDLFFNRWGLQFEPAGQIEELIKQLDEAKQGGCKELKQLMKKEEILRVHEYLKEREIQYGF